MTSEILKDGLIAVTWMIMGLAVGFELGGAWARSVGASARTRSVNDDATEPVPGDASALAPGAEPSPQPAGAKQIDVSSVKKPPLGLVPRYIRDEQRAREIIDAILRYIDNGRPVPHEWIDELERKTAKESEAK